MHFVWFRSTSLRVFKFVQIKEGGFNFWGEPIFQNVWIIWSPLLYLSLKSPMNQNSSSFIRFQSILHEWGSIFSESWNFYKLKRGDLISRRNQFWRMSELFVPPFCISILKVLWTKFYIVHCISMYSTWFRSTFFRVLKFVQIKEGGSNFWGEPILQNVWIIWSPLLYFSFKIFLDPNSSSFIRFESNLHQWGRLFQRPEISTN